MNYRHPQVNYRRAVRLSYEQFRYSFASAVSENEARQLYETYPVPGSGSKHSAHSRAVMGSADFGGCYGESACAGGRQGLPSMRPCRASMALRPCLRAVSM